jgi:hypothetical protein
MNNSSQVWVQGNLCCSIGAAYIPLMSTAYTWYCTKLNFSCCSMVRALIGCSMNCRTFPGFASTIFANSSVHSASCSACSLTTLFKSMKLLGVPNSGSPKSFIILLILPQCLLHLVHFSWISRCESRDILAQYSADCFMLLRLLFPIT